MNFAKGSKHGAECCDKISEISEIVRLFILRRTGFEKKSDSFGKTSFCENFLIFAKRIPHFAGNPSVVFIGLSVSSTY